MILRSRAVLRLRKTIEHGERQRGSWARGKEVYIHYNKLTAIYRSSPTSHSSRSFMLIFRPSFRSILLPAYKRTHLLNSTIILLIPRILLIRLPSLTIRIQLRLILHTRSDLSLPLHKLQSEALTRVPRDVAVHKPSTRVVGIESHNHPTISRKDSCVSSWWILSVEFRETRHIDSLPLSQDIKIMPMQMHRMKSINNSQVLYYPINPLIFGWDRVDIRERRKHA